MYSAAQSESIVSDQTNHKPISQVTHRVLFVGACFLCVTLGSLLQFTTYLNHDIAWIISSADKMISGAVFGKDVIAANPPLVWYLSYPVVFLNKFFQIPAPAAFRVVIATVALASAFWSWSIAKRTSLRPAANALLLSSLFVFFVDAYRDFGQRDYLAFLLCLPYLCLAASKYEGGKHSRFESLLIGVVAGIGWALKPYFLAVPVFVEFVLFRRSKLKFHLRTEVFSAVLTIFGYVVFLFINEKQYLFEAIPMIKKIYWGFESHAMLVIETTLAELAVTAMCGWLLMKGRRSAPTLPKVMFAASFGFLISYLVQNKGYSYHQAPFREALFVLIAVWISLIAANSKLKAQKQLLLFTLVCLTVVTLERTSSWYSAYNNLGIGGAQTNASRGAPAIQNRLNAVVNANAKDGRFIAFSTHPFPGFPTALYVDSEWSSRTNSRFFLPAIGKMRAAKISENDPRLTYAVEMEREYALRDLSLNPNVVLVDDSRIKHGLGRLSFDVLSFYLEDPEFAAIWENYEELEPIGSNRVFVRSET